MRELPRFTTVDGSGKKVFVPDDNSLLDARILTRGVERGSLMCKTGVADVF